VRLFLVALVCLAVASPAAASEAHPTRAELESELICPTCQQTLDQSDAPIAGRMKRFIAARIGAGDTKSEIKAALVEQFGERVLAAPPKKGFNLLAWLLPPVAISGAAAVLALLAWRWSRHGRRPRRQPEHTTSQGQRPLEPELERRVDDALARFE
jgi:cytochrome c-type biogenesis protein CcmH